MCVFRAAGGECEPCGPGAAQHQHVRAPAQPRQACRGGYLGVTFDLSFIPSHFPSSTANPH